MKNNILLIIFTISQIFSFAQDGKADNFRVMNRYYIIDGKIVMWNSYSQEIIEETSE